MAVRQQLTASVPLGVAAALCFSALLAANFRKNRGHRSRIAGKQKQDRVDSNPAAVTTTDRRPPEDDEQAFSLFESAGAEPHAPPMELSRSVLALLESFDVDPVRGESFLRVESYRMCHPCRSATGRFEKDIRLLLCS